jgi:uncharacterized protein YkuJ
MDIIPDKLRLLQTLPNNAMNEKTSRFFNHNRKLVLQRHFIAKHLKFNLNCIRYLFLLSFPRKRESSLFSDITGVLDARLRGHDVKK